MRFLFHAEPATALEIGTAPQAAEGQGGSGSNNGGSNGNGGGNSGGGNSGGGSSGGNGGGSGGGGNGGGSGGSSKPTPPDVFEIDSFSWGETTTGMNVELGVLSGASEGRDGKPGFATLDFAATPDMQEQMPVTHLIDEIDILF